jgi:branched-chain amino acid transport system permease protein
MKDFTNDNFINILFFLGLFLLIYALNIFMGTAIFERIVTNLFIYIILVVGLQVFMGNSGILSYTLYVQMIEFLNFP